MTLNEHSLFVLKPRIDKRRLFSNYHMELENIAIEFNFKRPSLKPEVILDQIWIYYGKSSKCIAEFQPSGKTVKVMNFG